MYCCNLYPCRRKLSGRKWSSRFLLANSTKIAGDWKNWFRMPSEDGLQPIPHVLLGVCFKWFYHFDLFLIISVPTHQPWMSQDPDLQPLWDVLDRHWGGQTLEDDDENDPLPLGNGDNPPDDSGPAGQVLAIEDGHVHDEGSEVLAIKDGEVKDQGSEVLATEDGQVEGQASEESKEPEEVPQTTWLSLRDLSISGPNEEVRQRAQQIRAELIRPGQGGAQDFSFSLEPRLPQLVHLGGSCSNQPFSQTPWRRELARRRGEKCGPAKAIPSGTAGYHQLKGLVTIPHVQNQRYGTFAMYIIAMNWHNIMVSFLGLLIMWQLSVVFFRHRSFPANILPIDRTFKPWCCGHFALWPGVCHGQHVIEGPGASDNGDPKTFCWYGDSVCIDFGASWEDPWWWGRW